MKAVWFDEVGGPEVLQYGEIDQPLPSVGQVRLRVEASAYNAADTGMRAGFCPIPVGCRTCPTTTSRVWST